MAITYPAFEGDGDTNGPRRPSLEDLGGDKKINLEGKPPPPTHPSADEWNEMVRLLVQMAGITPVLAFTVEFSAGDPYLARFWSINSTVSKDDVTLSDLGNGDTRATLPEGKFPTVRLDPVVVMNEATNATTISAELNESARTIRVRTTDESAAAGVDTRFTCLVY